MKETLSYRDPTTPDARERVPTPGRMMKVGAGICAASLALVGLPLVLHLKELANYLVFFGLAGFLLGINCLINAAIDWLRGR